MARTYFYVDWSNIYSMWFTKPPKLQKPYILDWHIK